MNFSGIGAGNPFFDATRGRASLAGPATVYKTRFMGAAPTKPTDTFSASKASGLIAVTPEDFLTQMTAAGKKLLVALDVDGTMVPFVPDVRDAKMTPEQVRDFVQLAELLNKTHQTPLCVITGRRFEDALDGLGGETALKGKPVIIITDQGLRSFDCQSWQEVQTPETAPLIAKARTFQQAMAFFVSAHCTPQKGFGVIEKKVAGLAINLDQAEQGDIELLERKFKDIARKLGMLPDDDALIGKAGDFTLVHEKGVLEIKPRLFNKGNAMVGLNRKFIPDEGGMSVFIGDSQTDNPAFSAATVGLYVGKPNPEVTAKYVFENAEDTEGPEAKTTDGKINQAERTRISRKNTETVNGFLKLLTEHLAKPPIPAEKA